MLVSSLIKSIRYKVGDSKGTKWYDTRIIEMLNEGLDNMAQRVQVKKINISLPVIPYQRELVVNDTKFVNLLRARVNDKNIPIIPFDKLDDIARWEDNVGESLTYIAYDKQNKGRLTLYPLLNDTSSDYSALNTATGIIVDIPNIDRDYVTGIITSVDASDLIIPENVYDPSQTETTGTLTSIRDLFITINLTYSAVPNTIITVEEEIDLDPLYFNLLKYYVSGMLLLDDNRTESVNKGTTFIQKYNTDIEVADDITVESYQTITAPITTYRTGFE